MYRPLSQKLAQLKTLHNSKPCTVVWPLMGKRAFRFLKDYFLGYNSKFGLNKIFYFFLSIDWLIFHEQYTFLYKHRNTLRYTCVRVLPGGSDGKDSVCKYRIWSLGWNDPQRKAGYLLQYSCRETSMDRRACQATYVGCKKLDMTKQWSLSLSDICYLMKLLLFILNIKS